MKIKLPKEARGIIIPGVKLSGPKRTLAVDLILDTGAAYTLISWDTAFALGFDPARRGKDVAIITANGRIHVPAISLKEVRIGDAAAKRVPTLCHDIPELTVEVSGLLGLSFLKHFRTTIDYRSLSLEII